MHSDLLSPAWQPGERFAFRFCFLFIILFFLSFSFPQDYLPDPGRYTTGLFTALAKWFSLRILRIHSIEHYEIVSDSKLFYISTLVVIILSLAGALLWSLLGKKSKSYPLLYYSLTVFIRYYLAMQLLVYGFNKLFKWQFYLPEPNTLFTTVGETSYDLLFWTSMGLSRPYSLFTGGLEILAGSLLLFRRTKPLGILVSLAVVIHITVINFSFDISVKLYSLFLLFLCIFLLAPYLRPLYDLFWMRKTTSLPPDYILSTRLQRYKRPVHITTLILLFGAVLGSFVQAGNFNDDKATRPFLHGAYTVSRFEKNGVALPPLLTDPLRWKRVFVHRRNYLIIQQMNDEMKDYELEYDTAHQYLWINLPGDSIQTNIRYRINEDSTLHFLTVINNDTLSMVLNKLNLQKLPAMQREFNFTAD